MARQFAMAKYANMEDLYKAKAEYWEKIAIDNIKFAFERINGYTPSEEQIEWCVDKTERDLDL
mgnify:CR=1 FL=1